MLKESTIGIFNIIFKLLLLYYNCNYLFSVDTSSCKTIFQCSCACSLYGKINSTESILQLKNVESNKRTIFRGKNLRKNMEKQQTIDF